MRAVDALNKICGLEMRFDEETREKSRAMDAARVDALRAGMQNGNQEEESDEQAQFTAPEESEGEGIEKNELDGINGLTALAFDLAESFETGNADLEKNVALFNGLHPM